MKRPVPLYDFKAFGQAIKEARKKKGESRNQASSALFISPRYLANIENKGQHPSLQVFYDLVTCYEISVDEFSSRISLQVNPPSAARLTQCWTA